MIVPAEPYRLIEDVGHHLCKERQVTKATVDTDVVDRSVFLNGFANAVYFEQDTLNSCSYKMCFLMLDIHSEKNASCIGIPDRGSFAKQVGQKYQPV